jgi:hypothetical protein
MKRYHEEKHIIDRRREEARQLHGKEYGSPGRYRKTHNGCNRASCQLCHPEKFPKRIPTRQETQSQKDLNGTDT